ncbi:U-box domain-containing protein 1 [Bienertia sinuspersici]
MNTSFQPSLPTFSGFPPKQLLLASLITISDEISSVSKTPLLQVKNILAMTRRVRLISPLFAEVQELNTSLLPSASLCFTELLSLMTRAKLLMQGCTEGSYLWNLIQTDVLSKEFHAIVKEMSKALDILPLNLMNITVDVREQVELCHKQTKGADMLVDPKDLERRKLVIKLIATTKEKNEKIHGFLEVRRVKEILSNIGLRNSFDFTEEISKLKAEATSQGGTGGATVVLRINSLINLLTHVRSMIFSFEENEMAFELLRQKAAANKPGPSSSQDLLTEVPNEFRCPLSEEIMREPVVVATGHSYDQDSISKWIVSGRTTCPKSGWKLTHMALIPNYNLKSLIHQWHKDNNINLDEFTASSSLHKDKTQRKSGINFVKLTSEFLVGKLATASPAMQCRAAYETRLLAKSSTDNRKAIAEAGAIPFLVNLLNSQEPAMQENAVTALLNLSINSKNKILIMEAAALERITVLLESGKTMEAKENAAATIASLLIVDDYKASIGAQPKVIAALAGITDDALALLALLSGCSEAMKEITRTTIKDLMILLIDLLKFGSLKGKENSVTLLLALTKDGAEVVKHLDPQSFSLLRNLIANGSSEAREKAGLLLRLLIKCCSNPANL